MKKSKEGSGSCVNAIREWQEVRPEKTGNKLPNQTFKFLEKGLKLGNEEGKHAA